MKPSNFTDQQKEGLFPFSECTNLKSISGTTSLGEQIKDIFPKMFVEGRIEWINNTIK